MPTCDTCGSELEIRPDEPGIRTRWYACPECDGSSNDTKEEQ